MAFVVGGGLARTTRCGRRCAGRYSHGKVVRLAPYVRERTRRAEIDRSCGRRDSRTRVHAGGGDGGGATPMDQDEEWRTVFAAMQSDLDRSVAKASASASAPSSTPSVSEKATSHDDVVDYFDVNDVDEDFGHVDDGYVHTPSIEELMQKLDHELDDLAAHLKYESVDEMLGALELKRSDVHTARELAEDERYAYEHSSDEAARESVGVRDDEHEYPHKRSRRDDRMSHEHRARYFCRALDVTGEVVRGFGRGSANLGVPTANLRVAQLGPKLEPLENGVYCGWARLGGVVGHDEKAGEVYAAVANVGVSPTFGDVSERMLEAHLLGDTPDDFYGRKLRLRMVAFLRYEMKFDGMHELLRNIKNDVLTSIIVLKSKRSLRHRRRLAE